MHTQQLPPLVQRSSVVREALLIGLLAVTHSSCVAMGWAFAILMGR